MKKTIALFGSARRNGNTGRLIDRIGDALGIEIIDLSEKNITPYDYRHRNRNDDFEPLMEYVLQFENIVFASPVYWYAVSPPMKISLDRISDYLDIPELLSKGRQLRGKNAFVVCTSIEKTVSKTFIDSFEHTFQYLGMNYGGYVHADCKQGYIAENYEWEVDAFIQGILKT